MTHAPGGRLSLITGGSRSGKSRHAQRLAEEASGDRAFIATCQVYDDEMRERVARHREERAGSSWRTVEETTDLARAIREARESVLLIDCLTLWVTNLLLADEDGMNEEIMTARSHEVLDAAREHGGAIYFVTNEVGLGIVPDNKLARRFRDLAGRTNQIFAAAADRVVLLVSGLPVVLK